MDARITSWVARRKSVLLEWFVLANLAFLVADVFLAHSVNSFRHPAEWVPFVFAAVATMLLVPALTRKDWAIRGSYARRAGLAVGFGSVAVGIAGVVYHLQSQFVLPVIGLSAPTSAGMELRGFA